MKKTTTVFLFFLFLSLFLSIRILIFIKCFNSYDLYSKYYAAQSPDGTYYDAEIVFKKLCPNFFSMAFSIKKWKEKQIAEDEQLYLKSRDAYLRINDRNYIPLKNSEKTFEERYKDY